MYVSCKSKKVLKWTAKMNAKPLFVQAVLAPIWSVYKAVKTQPNEEQVAKILTSQNLSVAQKDWNNADKDVAIQVFVACFSWRSSLVNNPHIGVGCHECLATSIDCNSTDCRAAASKSSHCTKPPNREAIHKAGARKPGA
jgi:hypothetical protein